MTPEVTLITATYDRPHLLRQVIRTVRCQTLQEWRWIIVGDACSDATGALIAEFDDPRITYVNLPQRFGEQAGPNSVGLALAKTPCIAFLNHDDLWLPDHLEAGLAELTETGSDLCIMRAAFLGPRGPATAQRAAFAQTCRLGRDIAEAYEAPFSYFEPISSWIGTRAFFERLGPMGLATTLAMPPVRDWALRIAQSGARVTFPDALTVIKHVGSDAYDTEASHLGDIAALIEAGNADAVREQIADDQWLAAQLGAGGPWRAPMPAEGEPGHGLTIHARCGLDRASLDAAARRKPGAMMRAALRRRTGEKLGSQPDISEAIAHARQLLLH